MRILTVIISLAVGLLVASAPLEHSYASALEWKSDAAICRVAVNTYSPSWNKFYPAEITEAKRRNYTALQCYRINYRTSPKKESKRTAYGICKLAVSLTSPSWDKRYPEEIAEAKRRGYSASQCFTLAGYTAATPQPSPAKKTAAAPKPPPPPTFWDTLSREDIRSIQTALNLVGFNAGAADGIAGRRTKRALEAYQQKRGLVGNAKTITALVTEASSAIASRKAAAERRIREEKARQAEALAAAERKEAETEILPVSTGSAFAITSTGHLLTNHHVVEDCELVVLHLSGERFEKTTVIASDKTNDLSVLKADYTPEEIFKISTRNAGLLEDIVVAGFPLSDKLSSSVKVTKGVVSSLAGVDNDYSQIQIDAAIQPGSSGGPIIDSKGNVVAIAVSALNKSTMLKRDNYIPENTNFGVKASTARTFLEANSIALQPANNALLDRAKMAGVIQKATHMVSCWMTRKKARELLAKADRSKTINVSPAMQRKVEALQ